MFGWMNRYKYWLHTQWPAGKIEKMPVVGEQGATNVPGVYVTGDLTGIPLLKLSADGGARAVHAILEDAAFKNRDQSDQQVLDIAIVGGGVSGFSAAIEAKKAGLKFTLYEAAESFSTIANFPKGKPIFTYPTDMTPAGDLQFHEKSSIKEGLLEDLQDQTLAAGIEPQFLRIDRVRRTGKILELIPAKDGDVIRSHRVIIAIGRSGNFRKLGVPGENLSKVYNRLHDPADFCRQSVLVVGGGDSAMETAIALATCGCNVTMSYRKPQFSRPKPENVEKINQLTSNPAADVSIEEPTGDRVTTASGHFQGKDRQPGSLNLMMASNLKEVREDQVIITNSQGQDETIPNDAAFAMIGREAPLGFFRRSGIHINGEWRQGAYVRFVLFLLLCIWLYHWKSDKIPAWGIDPQSLWAWITSLNDTVKAWAADPRSLFHTLTISANGRSFYYTLVYTMCIVIFGIRRVRRRKTPYVKLQTFTLAVIQIIPLFLLPEIILPYLGHNGVFSDGWLKSAADALFPLANYGHGRAYWHSYGFILAWPLFISNVFTSQPMWAWLIISLVQTFIIIPALIYRYGKGVYCGWICPCGALAETMGDTHRHKMPHGFLWNRMNMIGQVFLAVAMFLLITRIGGWIWPGSIIERTYQAVYKGIPVLNYSWFVDLLWAGIIGVGCYFWFSGRVWCRFACPLAALMHIYARFSQFRILPEKKKCISCNVCTSVCHQGIDVMNFANKGLGMSDPQCVRCSACVQSCPTGVLSFGRINTATNEVIKKDTLPASGVQIAELTINGNSSGDSKLNRILISVAAALVLLITGVMWAASENEYTPPKHAATSQPATSQPASSQPAVIAAAAPVSNKATIDAPNHSSFDVVLKKIVRKDRVDYKIVSKSYMSALADYLVAMAKVDHKKLKKNDRFAFYINVYNATVIHSVANRYKSGGGYSVSEKKFKLFSEKLVKLNDGVVSLDYLEKTMAWNAFHDPRMHVAFVCAARSCPPILTTAYLGKDLDKVLNASMKMFVSGDPSRNQIDVKKKTAKLSELFTWYADDFGGSAQVLKYIDKYHPESIVGFKINYLKYDWTLNDID